MAALKRRTEHQLTNAIKLAHLIGTSLVVPAANDLALMLRPDLDEFYAAIPLEFRDRARAEGCGFDVLLLSPGDRFTFRESPASYPGLFQDKEDFLRQLNTARQRPDVIETGRRLAEWEQEFSFDPTAFFDVMKAYCQDSVRLSVPALRPRGQIVVGLRVVDGDREHRFRIVYGPEHRSIDLLSGAFAHGALHMVVGVGSNLLGMAFAGGCTFEDLMNCRWSVTRFRDYSLDEVSFWAFLSAFTPYLEMNDRQPRRGERDRLKYMPPWTTS
jgi:hypothetical protein